MSFETHSAEATLWAPQQTAPPAGGQSGVRSLLCAGISLGLLVVALIFAGLVPKLPDAAWINYIAIPLGLVTSMAPPILQIAGLIFAVNGLRRGGSVAVCLAGLIGNALLLAVFASLWWGMLSA